MDKSNEICINITKALITSITIDLSDGEKPKYTVQGGLTTDKGKKVSDFVFWNQSWASDKEIEIPVEVHMHAAEIFRALKPIVYRKLNDEYPMLTRVTQTDEAVNGETVEEPQEPEEPTIIEPEPDDIPF